MTPQLLLAILIALTLVAFVVDKVRQRRRREAVRQLAIAWRLNFGPADSLQLTARLVRHFPVPGVAALRVSNLIYGIDGDAYRFYFTAEYTVGVTAGKRRITRVGTFLEPRDRRRGGETSLILADEGLPIIEQYHSVKEQSAGTPL